MQNTDPIAIQFKSRPLERWFGKYSILRRTTRRRIHAVSLVVTAIIIICSLFAAQLAPYHPNDTHPRQGHKGIFAASTETNVGWYASRFWLGTDEIGRDLLSRLIFGARVSLQVGFMAVGLALVVGIPLGLLAGFRGGILDEVIMRFMDAIFMIPTLALALAIAAALGPSLTNVVIAIGVTNIPRYARIVRGQVLSVREHDYVLAARSIGSPGMRVALLTVLPNSIQPVIVQATLSTGFAILAEAGLSFLGVGIQPPTASWGAMLQGGYRYLERNLIESMVPGLAIFVTVLSVNLLGDGLREALDPRLRGT